MFRSSLSVIFLKLVTFAGVFFNEFSGFNTHQFYCNTAPSPHRSFSVYIRTAVLKCLCTDSELPRQLQKFILIGFQSSTWESNYSRTLTFYLFQREHFKKVSGNFKVFLVSAFNSINFTNF